MKDFKSIVHVHSVLHIDKKICSAGHSKPTRLDSVYNALVIHGQTSGQTHNMQCDDV